MSLRRVAALVMFVALALEVQGENELTVEPRRVPADESVRIKLVLRDGFAGIDSVEIPLENLELKGPPSTSVEMSFVNGASSRRKTLTWWASPKQEGPARVGPIVLVGAGNAKDELPAVDVVVSPQPILDASNPAQALDQLYMSGRDQVLLAVEVPKRELWQGEGVDVTWYLYTAASIRRYAISQNPKLDGFWVEEEPVDDAVPEEVVVGGHPVQRIAIRRATLFPLRSGALEIPPMEAGVEVIRPLSDPFGSFGMLEGRVVDVKRRTATSAVEVKPLAGAVDAVGSFSMQRTAPKLSPAGTVAFDVTVRGTGSLRAAKPPRWVVPIDADVQIEELDNDITSRGPLTMTRRWRFVVFPRASGRLVVPGLTLSAFDPAKGTAYAISTTASEITVTRPAAEAKRDGAGGTLRKRESGGTLAVVALVAGILGTTLLAARMLRGRRHDAAELSLLMARVESPRELRRALSDLATRHGREPRALFAEAGELGDAWRSVHSFADLAEKEPESVGDLRRELRKRAVRLLPLMRKKQS